MPRKVPVVRELRWIYALPQLASVALAVGEAVA
jgi:hypothetical protein